MAKNEQSLTDVCFQKYLFTPKIDINLAYKSQQCYNYIKWVKGFGRKN